MPRHGRDWLLVGAVLLAGALLRLWVLAHTSGLTMDSPLYVRMAEQLGRRWEPLGPAHHGYPALVLAASLFAPGRELPGRLVSFVAGLLLVIVTFALARRRLPAWGAAVAASLVALHPLLSLSSGAVMTESSFQALTYAALLALDAGRAALAAAMLGLAYWVRPEALPVAAGAIPWVAAGRPRVVWLAAFALAALPEVAILSVERGAFTVTPKTNLIAAAGAAQDDAEWRAAAAESLAAPGTPPAAGGFLPSLRAIAARYPARLAGHLVRLIQTWPAPLMALSLIGAVARPGLLLAPFAILPVLPLLGVTPHLRYPQTLVPSLAVFAAIGSAWCLARVAAERRRLRTVVVLALALALAAGIAWCWRGPAGDSIRRSEDAPIASLRKAGRWLAAHGPPGALVMDRKPYLPFFAGMRHALMPDDDYDTLVEHARRTGVDYVVVEEFVMWRMRRQFVPLMTDSTFRAGERRLRMVYGAGDGPMTGVAIFEVVRP